MEKSCLGPQDRKQPKHRFKVTNSTPLCNSEIENHLPNHQNSASQYKTKNFAFLQKQLSNVHLSVLKSVFIASRKSKLPFRVLWAKCDREAFRRGPKIIA